MPPTIMQTVRWEDVPPKIIDDWQAELGERIPSDKAPLPYDEMTKRMCRRLMIRHIINNGSADLQEIHGDIHKFLDDLDSLGFYDPVWEQAINDAWREIVEQLGDQ